MDTVSKDVSNQGKKLKPSGHSKTTPDEKWLPKRGERNSSSLLAPRSTTTSVLPNKTPSSPSIPSGCQSGIVVNKDLK
ncbi:hypothetical protein EYF80_009213 [Liparis tanakae]|uniref:Uncharacterized protein n=1 Tax=Liparis tanakae TaxID=230148 RepID=A0A4Z2ISI0_9TELE|nr:hypothetical protein EYF80_009213 [Liparis tanakae]